MAAVNGVILLVMSNISQTLETQYLLVSFDSIMLMAVIGFRHLIFLVKFISLMSSEMTSSFGNYFIPATFMLSSSSDNYSGGSWFEKLIPFNTKPLLLRTTSNSSAIFNVPPSYCSPDIQSSTYISSLTLGYSTCDNLAVSHRVRSAWLSLDFTPYIKILMTFLSGILVGSRSCCQIYHCKHRSCNLIELCIFLMSVWKATLWVYCILPDDDFNKLFILFLPLAKMSLRL